LEGEDELLDPGRSALPPRVRIAGAALLAAALVVPVRPEAEAGNERPGLNRPYEITPQPGPNSGTPPLIVLGG
jgi:hypothetical protein